MGESTSVCGAGTVACNLTGGLNVPLLVMLYRQERAIETRCRSWLCASHTMSVHSSFSDSYYARQRGCAAVLESAGSSRNAVGHDHCAAIRQGQSSVVTRRRTIYLSRVHIRWQGEAEVSKCPLGGHREVASVVLILGTFPKPKQAIVTDNRHSHLSPGERRVASRTNAMVTHSLSPLWQRQGVPPSCYRLAPQRAIASLNTFRTRKSHQSAVLASGDEELQCMGQTSKTHDGNTWHLGFGGAACVPKPQLNPD
ncbi:Serine/threonine-protein phosphatase 7 long form-like protein [Senna tora]|uniref:Serine/threonine-protein phosphatase 7 long form-like protein n=1 Tax=Senna tora TaxID=362788 RepID=A0A835CG67_9FABA|nr:Serine/threonine-protein phosphatase 7 long form-like protein [Senna tora]